MIVIRLFCNQGMSTSLLVSKMRDAAARKGIEADIAAFPTHELEENISGIDCALLGPQVGYLKSRMSGICGEKGVPLDVIPITEYGRCDGEKVLEFAMKLAGK